MDEDLYLERESLLDIEREIISDISRYSIALSKNGEISEQNKKYLKDAYKLKIDILFSKTRSELAVLSFRVGEYRDIAARMEVLVNGL